MKNALIILVLLITKISCSQNLEQSWTFHSVTKDSTTLLKINENNDYLELKHRNFYYQLKAKNNLVASGNYIRKNNQLVFFYTQPSDTIRTYQITTLTDSTLTLSENNIKYKFLKKRTHPIKNDVTTNDVSEQIIKASSMNFSGILRGALGMLILISVCYLLSANKKAINWTLVASGLSLQIVFAFLLKLNFVI